jgi:integrase
MKILQKLAKNTKYVFLDTNGSHMLRMPRQWQLLVDDMIEGNTTAGKYRITVHSLRHTHALTVVVSYVLVVTKLSQLDSKKALELKL